MLMTSIPDLYTIKVVTSLIRYDHRAIVATIDGKFTDLHKTRSQISFRRRSPDQNAALLDSLRSLDVSEFLEIYDAQEAWNFSNTRLERIYPIRTITITSKDPEFLTSKIKSLLRRKNRLMRRGHVEKAESIGKRVTKAVEKITSSTFRLLVTIIRAVPWLYGIKSASTPNSLLQPTPRPASLLKNFAAASLRPLRTQVM